MNKMNKISYGQTGMRAEGKVSRGTEGTNVEEGKGKVMGSRGETW